MVIECQSCGRELGQADGCQPDGALRLSCLLPACYRCGQPGEVPIRPHGMALCLNCWQDALNTTVGTESEPVPA